MNLSTELEQLRKRKVDLIDELQSIREEERALKEIVDMLEDKLAIQELAPPPLPIKPLEWCSSPEKVRSLYSS